MDIGIISWQYNISGDENYNFTLHNLLYFHLNDLQDIVYITA